MRTEREYPSRRLRSSTGSHLFGIKQRCHALCYSSAISTLKKILSLKVSFHSWGVTGKIKYCMCGGGRCGWGLWSRLPFEGSWLLFWAFTTAVGFPGHVTAVSGYTWAQAYVLFCFSLSLTPSLRLLVSRSLWLFSLCLIIVYFAWVGTEGEVWGWSPVAAAQVWEKGQEIPAQRVSHAVEISRLRELVWSIGQKGTQRLT